MKLKFRNFWKKTNLNYFPIIHLSYMPDEINFAFLGFCIILYIENEL